MLLHLFPQIVAVVFGLHYEPKDTVAAEKLDAITISAQAVNTRTSPLRLVDINRQEIISNAAGSTFPELIKNVPGVYATSETGSFGDAKINIRGFKQENISVLLNGIPISGLTSGSMYWNNWMGLADATAKIQVQKGIGNSMISDNSVGGTINIITNQPTEKPNVEASYSHTSYGANSASVSINSGFHKGWAISLMGSHNWGRSYAEYTDMSTWSYLLAITKRFKANHSLNFTAMGSPETHAQRSQRLTYAEVEKYGRNYNKNWGWDINGKRTLSQNKYFKPYFTLTHIYSKEKLQLSTTAYAALANGGGLFTESKGNRIASYITDDGLIDWRAARASNGDSAQNIITHFLAGHTQLGLKSNVIIDITPYFKLDSGIHYQFYDTWEKEKITDLLGADYWYEPYEENALHGLLGRDPIKKVGDLVRVQNGREQHYITLYTATTYQASKIIVNAGASISGTILKRWDTYNYAESDKWSQWTGGIGGSAKIGVLYKLNQLNSFYLNGAVYSRAPYYNIFFSNGNNMPSKDITNEKNILSEIGYRRTGNRFAVEATAYAAYWIDKAIISSPYKSLDEDPYRFMVKGLNALHIGLEINASFRISRLLKAECFASIGDWRWKNDVQARIYDPVTSRPIQEINIYTKNLHIGDAPQTQIGTALRLDTGKMKAYINWNYNDRLWADFDPVSRTDPEFRGDSYRLPSYHLLNAGISWHPSIKKLGLMLFVNINNITDSYYVERGRDGYNHDKDSFTGYWGNGSNFNFGIRLAFPAFH